MQRLITIVALSLAVVAGGLAGVSLLQSSRDRVDGDEQEMRLAAERLATSVTALRHGLAQLSSRVETLELRSIERSPEATAAESAVEAAVSDPAPASLEETIAALRERIDSLESAETIHDLAQSGRKRATRRKLVNALADLRDPDASPDELLAAMGTIRQMRKQSRKELAGVMEEHELEEADLAWPMLDIARDGSVDAEIRGEALESLQGLQTPEIREPLLDIFASDDALPVRTGAFDALAWHMGDPAVRRVLRDAANESQPPEIRSRATRLEPKLDSFDRRDAESAAGGGEK